MIKEFEKVYRLLKVLNEKSASWENDDIKQIKVNKKVLEESWKRVEEKYNKS